MLSTHTLFEWLVVVHIATGTVGLIVVWIPIAGKKGGALHRRAGTLFVQSMIATGFTAVAISLTTLSDPLGTHPQARWSSSLAIPQTTLPAALPPAQGCRGALNTNKPGLARPQQAA